MTIDRFVLSAEEPIEAYQAKGANIRSSVIVFAKEASDIDASVLRLIKGFPAEAVIKNIIIANDAIASATDIDLGIYDVNSGAVVSKDIFLNGGSLASGRARGSELSAISSIAVADSNKKLWELLGKTVANKSLSYDLCLTGNTFGSDTGTIVVIVDYLLI